MRHKILKDLIVIYAFILCCMIFASHLAYGLQIKESESDGEIEAFIAADELSRIKVISDRIKSVKSNEGEVEVVEDSRLGEIFIRPTRNNNEPINVFITTEKDNVFKLILLPKRMPSEQVFIKNISITKEMPVQIDWRESIIALVRIMRSKEFSSSYKKVDTDADLEINGYQLHKQCIYLGDLIKGEVFEYQNKLDTSVTLTSEQLYENGILALSIDKETLEPEETTKIYIVKKVING